MAETYTDDEVVPTGGYGPREDELALDESGNPPATLPASRFLPRDRPAAAAAPEEDDIRLDENGNPPQFITPDKFFDSAGSASRPGAFVRGAAEGVIPAAAGLGGGILSGAATGAGLGALGANPFTVGAGALIGGVIGGLGIGYGASRLQEAGLEASGLREGEGWLSRRQKETDEALYPYARAAGGMAAALPALRPGGTLVERGISGVIGAGAEAVSDYASTGHVDW